MNLDLLNEYSGGTIFTEDATYYAEQVRIGRMSALELVEYALGNIADLNSKLNAVTHVQVEEAISLAKQYDSDLASGRLKLEELPPFYGVPILIKDLGQMEEGQPSSCGSKLFLDAPASVTSNFVKRIKEAGFIIVGRTNVPEFGFKNISDAKATGAVNCPLDLNRNAGGSSGGSAAALKAGIVPIVSASDGGGSIRIPSSFNGLIGLKPSRGRVPVGPDSYRGWQGASISFFITKSVRDTWALLKWMDGFQAAAPFSVEKIEENELRALDRRLRIAYTLTSPTGSEVSIDAKEAVRCAVRELQLMGHTVVEASPNVDGMRLIKSYYMVNEVETAVMVRDIEEQFGRSLNMTDMEMMSWAIYCSGLNVSAVDYSEILSYWDKVSADMDQFFEEYDILIAPTTNGVAPIHGELDPPNRALSKLGYIDSYEGYEQQKIIWDMFEKSLAYTPFTQQQNIAGQPAISLPLYFTSQNLPIGTQFSARKGNEYLLLQLARELEENGFLRVETSFC